MNESQLLTLAASLVAVMFGLLTAVLGWIGNRMYSKMEELGKTLSQIAGDLHQRINNLDTRVTKVETQHELCDRWKGGQ